jgi:hypothetical protein
MGGREGLPQPMVPNHLSFVELFFSPDPSQLGFSCQILDGFVFPNFDDQVYLSAP